ncbi:MAG: ATP-dependent RNA helicase HrpA, partial [Deltaproteobacteria bacterium CG17_big_fil_post_rev_8_21_14_2_50_51_6]
MNSPDVKLNARIKRILGRMPIMMARDRIRIRKLIEDFLSIPKTEKSARTPSDHIKFIEKLVWKSIERRKSRKASLPPLDFPGNLPIISLKAKIIESIKANQVVIISGETGSGKSTQIPKMCLLAGRGLSGMIGCTQPRRIAAYAVST